jgi:hypothetical protein
MDTDFTPTWKQLVNSNRVERGMFPITDGFTREQYLQLINWKLDCSVGMTEETRAMHVMERKFIMAEIGKEHATSV